MGDLLTVFELRADKWDGVVVTHDYSELVEIIRKAFMDGCLIVKIRRAQMSQREYDSMEDADV